MIEKINPRKIKRWDFADRSAFEFGDIYALSMDIKTHGQVEPITVRRISDNEYDYEVIAGSRRWKACLELGIDVIAHIKDLNDQEAFIIQVKENDKQPISDYSKGMHYHLMLENNKTTINDLTIALSCSKEKIYSLLTFANVPQRIWDAVMNMSKVSSRTARTILTYSNKGEEYIDAIIALAEDIRKGVGCRRLEKMINEAVHGEQIIDSANALKKESSSIRALFLISMN